MAEILSQSQIDELLNNLNSGEIDIKEIESQSKEKKIKEYDFRSPKKITKEIIKLMNSIFENYCRMMSSNLTSILRTSCDVAVEQIEESRFNEYNNALDDYVLMALVDVEYPDKSVSDNQILMEVSKPLSFMIIDRLLGGSGYDQGYVRDYTDIEMTLLSNLFRQIVPKIGNSCETTMDLKTRFDRIETNSRFVQSVNYNDTVIVVVLNISLNQSGGKITICIPSNILDEILKKSDIYSKSYKKKTADSNYESQKESIMISLKESALTITGILGYADATLRDILNMQPGDLIILDKRADSNVDVSVDGENWFEGKWGTKNKKSVIKINKIIH
jgi:flagellar motor switch protein FliM